MKIAYVCADLGVPVFGCKGCSIHVQEVIRAFLMHGAEVTLFTPRTGGEPPPDLAQVKVIELSGEKNTGDSRQREIYALDLNDQITAALEKAGPFDMIYERYALWSFATMEYARAQGIPGILEVNAPLIEEQNRHRQLFNRNVAERTTRRVFEAASALVAVSDGVAAYLNTFGETRGRVHVIGNGVNPARFARMPESEQGQYTIGFVGTLKPWHGLDDLITAFTYLHRNHPESRLLIVGDGPKRAELEQTVASLGLTEAVHFTGAVTPDQVPDLLAGMEVAVAPYPDSEDFYFSPLKVLEYMGAGLPVVASRIGQITSLIDHGRNGMLCPPGEPVALARTLEALLVKPAQRHILGAEARRTVIDAHSWQTVTRRILRLAALRGPVAAHLEKQTLATEES